MGFNFPKREKVEFTQLGNSDNDSESAVLTETETAVELALLRAKVRVLTGILIFTGLVIFFSAIIGFVVSNQSPKPKSDKNSKQLVPSDALIPKCNSFQRIPMI